MCVCVTSGPSVDTYLAGDESVVVHMRVVDPCNQNTTLNVRTEVSIDSEMVRSLSVGDVVAVRPARAQLFLYQYGGICHVRVPVEGDGWSGWTSLCSTCAFFSLLFFLLFFASLLMRKCFFFGFFFGSSLKIWKGDWSLSFFRLCRQENYRFLTSAAVVEEKCQWTTRVGVLRSFRTVRFGQN